jgi:hypothetical protein
MNLLAQGGKLNNPPPDDVGYTVGEMVGEVVTVVTGSVGMTPDPETRRPDTVVL